MKKIHKFLFIVSILKCHCIGFIDKEAAMKYLLLISCLILCFCSSEKEDAELEKKTETVNDLCLLDEIPSYMIEYCSREFFTPAFYFDEEKFKSELDIWKSQDIKNYSFTLKGELPYTLYPRAKNYYGAILMHKYEVKITVKNGIMDSFEYIGEVPYDMDYSSENPFLQQIVFEPEYTSISDVYKKMYEQIKNHEFELLRSASDCIISMRYEIEYNQESHYITRYKPIFEIYKGCIMDTSLHEVTVSDFTIVSAE